MASPAYETLKQTTKLPSPTGVALEILRLAGDETATLDSIVKVVESDPATAGRLLKLVNSPFAGVSRSVASVSLAVRLLGLRTVRNLAMGFSLVANNREGPCKAFDYARFWSESLACAVAARAVAQRANGISPDEAFVLGLLSQVGRLGLATACPGRYAEILTQTAGLEMAQLLAAEHDAFGIDHNELTAEMMADWGLEEPLCKALQGQGPCLEDGRMTNPSPDRLGCVLRLASSVAAVLLESEPRPATLASLTGNAGEHGIAPHEFDGLFDFIRDEWRQAGLIFSVGTRDMPPLEQIRAQAAAASQTCEPSVREAPAGPGRTAMRILIADDDPSALRLLHRHLVSAGYQVFEASCGEEALRIDRAQAPHMILTDWMMPDLNGLELCRRIRAREAACSVYVIVVTANSEKKQVIEALNAGADDFLSKPYSREELLARVRAGERVVRLQADLSAQNHKVSAYNAKLSVMNEQLQIMATTDPLTGLSNRREAMTRLTESWALSTRHDRPLSCILADIDHFKRINDNHGHDVGDLVLQEVARRFQKTLRAGEAVCRMGGEEFLVICPNSSAEAARRAAERLRVAMAHDPIRSGDLNLQVTISLGVAERIGGMERPDVLLKVADEALYAAKAAGRNRVCVRSSRVHAEGGHGEIQLTKN